MKDDCDPLHWLKTKYVLNNKEQQAFETSDSVSKVSFIIGGAQKGGTTALDTYLRKHPSVLMARKKEVHFFDNEALFLKTKVDYGLYHAYFALNHSSSKILGEATPIYMYWYAAPRRVWEYNPAMRWILMLRNPIDRAYSHWNMERSRGQEDLPFFEAIKNEREDAWDALPEQHRVYSYVDRGFYTEQIRRIWHYFPVEQTLILKSEDLQDSPEPTLNKVCSFLGVEDMPKVSYEMTHVGEYVTAMSDGERAYLKNIFEAEVRTIEKLLDWDCTSWIAL